MASSAISASRPSLLICYASVSGTAVAGAHRLRDLLGNIFRVSMLNLADFSDTHHGSRFKTTALTLFVTSTYGSGDVPESAKKFLAWLTSPVSAGEDAACHMPDVAACCLLLDKLADVKYTVLGYGSSSYPRFCEAANTFQQALAAAGAQLVAPMGKVDAARGAEGNFMSFLRSLADSLQSQSFKEHVVQNLAALLESL
eukprot:gene9223-11334_t